MSGIITLNSYMNKDLRRLIAKPAGVLMVIALVLEITMVTSLVMFPDMKPLQGIAPGIMIASLVVAIGAFMSVVFSASNLRH